MLSDAERIKISLDRIKEESKSFIKKHKIFKLQCELDIIYEYITGYHGDEDLSEMLEYHDQVQKQLNLRYD